MMRRMFAAGLTSICFLAIFMVVTVTAAEAPGVPSAPPHEPQLTRGGYSIFHETMVDLSWPEVEKAAAAGAIILFPAGVIEEHGPHMSLGVDTYAAYLICKLVRRELEARGIRALIAPPFYWGINNATRAFPGSFNSRPSTVIAVLYDALESLKNWGFKNVFFINYHGDPPHSMAILNAAAEARAGTGIQAYLLMSLFNATRWKLLDNKHVLVEKPAPPSTTPPLPYVDMHAGKDETGMMAYFFPDGQVDIPMAGTLPNTELTRNIVTPVWTEGGAKARQLVPLGYAGYPALFDANAAGASHKAGAQRTADLVESFLKGTYKPPTP